MRVTDLSAHYPDFRSGLSYVIALEEAAHAHIVLYIIVAQDLY